MYFVHLNVYLNHPETIPLAPKRLETAALASVQLEVIHF